MRQVVGIFFLMACKASAQTPAVTYRIATVAGSANTGDGSLATLAQIGNIQGIALDRMGNTYLSDADHSLIRKIDTKGIITTIAGIGTVGFSGDGGPAASA